MIWYLWQIRTAVKYIQILRQHTTHKEKKHQVLFATTRKLNKKHTHFLKEAFLLLFFLNPPLQNIWRHFLSSFCVCICKSFLLFYMFLYKNLSFKTGITGFGEWYRYVFFCHVWFWRIEQAELLKTKFHFASVFAFGCFSSCLLFLFFFSYQNVTDINISLTPQIGSHGHKKTPDCYTKGHSKVKKSCHLFFFFFWLKHLLKKHCWFCRLSPVYVSSSTVE